MEITKRDDSEFELTFTDKDGDPINLEGCTVFFTVKRNPTDPDDDAVIAKEITEFAYGDQGIANLIIDRDEANISVGDYYFDLQLKNTDDKIMSSSVGKFMVNQDITIRTDVDSGS